MLDTILVDIVMGARLLVAGAFVLSAIIALTHWGVRRGSIPAFGAWARFVRGWSDPILRPLEKRLARSGANPQDAPWWLVGVVIVAGLGVIALVNWLVGFGLTVYESANRGFFLALVVHTVFQLLEFAIIIRVIASWLALSPYSWLMRIINSLTDWLIEPIRRVVPTIGMFDISPMVAYFVLYLAEQVVIRGLF